MADANLIVADFPSCEYVGCEELLDQFMADCTLCGRRCCLGHIELMDDKYSVLVCSDCQTRPMTDSDVSLAQPTADVKKAEEPVLLTPSVSEHISPQESAAAAVKEEAGAFEREALKMDRRLARIWEFYLGTNVALVGLMLAASFLCVGVKLASGCDPARTEPCNEIDGMVLNKLVYPPAYLLELQVTAVYHIASHPEIRRYMARLTDLVACAARIAFDPFVPRPSLAEKQQRAEQDAKYAENQAMLAKFQDRLEANLREDTALRDSTEDALTAVRKSSEIIEDNVKVAKELHEFMLGNEIYADFLHELDKMPESMPASILLPDMTAEAKRWHAVWRFVEEQLHFQRRSKSEGPLSKGRLTAQNKEIIEDLKKHLEQISSVLLARYTDPTDEERVSVTARKKLNHVNY